MIDKGTRGTEERRSRAPKEWWKGCWRNEWSDWSWGKRWWKGCWRNDRLDSVGWAAIFLWAALVLVAESTNLKSSFGWWDGWGVFLTGAGVIVLLETALRLLVPEFRASWWWTLICGLVLLSIGLGSWDGWGWVWALVLAAVGVAILRGAFARNRSSGNGDPDGESWCGA